MQTAQLIMDFSTASRINKEKLAGQNKLLFEYLEKGTVTIFNTPGIRILNSRISDLRNKVGIIIHDRFVNINGTTCKEYSLTPFDNN
ncbi:MAG: hypothetical protein JWO92_2514 [Chitinophagaceae bacterium]|nr:hypothetical protein [Chitinophagaceae bacterium]